MAESPELIWEQICEMTEKYFYRPPLDEMRMVFAACHAHFWFSLKAIWLHIVGPSSTGKTVLGIDTMASVPCFQHEGSLTPRTLLSGKDKDKHGKKSKLYRLTPIPGMHNQTHGIFGVSDFSQFLSTNKWDQDRMSAQFRDLADGHLEHSTGEGAPTWRGKVTVLAAVTPAIERFAWVNRDLGERFLRLHWPTQEHSYELGRRIYERNKTGVDPLLKLRPLVKELIYRQTEPPALSPSQIDTITDAAKGLADSRRMLDEKGEDAGAQEGSSRLIERLQTFASAHASLCGREEASTADVQAALRIAADTIPIKRRRILSIMPSETSLDKDQIKKLTGLPNTTAGRHIAELVQLGLIEETTGSIGSFYTLRPFYAPLIRTLHQKSTENVISIHG